MAVKTTYQTLKENLIQKKMHAYLSQHSISEDELKVTILDELGITPRQLTYWIQNLSQPSLEEAFVIAQILGCTLNDLVK